MKLTDKAVSPFHRVLIYGPPKTGKTQLAGALSQYYNLDWIDLENGYTTLLKNPKEWQERVNIVSIPDTKAHPIGIETALKIVKSSGLVSICDTHGKVSCLVCIKQNASISEVNFNAGDSSRIIVFDSLTQLTNSAISFITKGKDDDYRLEYGDYAYLGKIMDIFLGQIQQAEANVICISHESEAEMEDGKIKLVPVAGTRNFSRNTAKYFDHVVYTEVKNKSHRFYSSTISANNLNTGSRTGVDLEAKDSKGLLDIFGVPHPIISIQPQDESPLIAVMQETKQQIQVATGPTKEQTALLKLKIGSSK